MWKSFQMGYVMMFSIHLMRCEYRDVSLLMKVQPSQRATVSRDSALTGSKDALCIQPSALELSVNDKIYETFPSCWIVMQIDIIDVMSYNRLSVSFQCHSGGIMHIRARLLSLQPPIMYSQASDHSVTVGMKKTMLLIGTPLAVIRWKNLIHSWRSWRFQCWIRCGPHLFSSFHLVT